MDDLKVLCKMSEEQYRKHCSSESGIVVENTIPDSRKANLVVDILNLLTEEQLSLNQMLEILALTQAEAFKIPIIGVCSKNG